MKKALILVLALLISSCATNNDPVEDTQDPVIGVWKPVREAAVFMDGTEISEAVSPCEQNNRITFMANGQFSQTDYQEGPDPNCMQPVGNLFLSGTWMQLSENQYHVELICSMPGCDDVIVESPIEITFPTADLMHVREDDDDPMDDIDYFYIELERLE